MVQVSRESQWRQQQWAGVERGEAPSRWSWNCLWTSCMSLGTPEPLPVCRSSPLTVYPQKSSLLWVQAPLTWGSPEELLLLIFSCFQISLAFLCHQNIFETRPCLHCHHPLLLVPPLSLPLPFSSFGMLLLYLSQSYLSILPLHSFQFPSTMKNVVYECPCILVNTWIPCAGHSAGSGNAGSLGLHAFDFSCYGQFSKVIGPNLHSHQQCLSAVAPYHTYGYQFKNL